MTTASSGVAVIATQLAQTDRRALSEAWYSALHLTRNAAPQRPHAAKAFLVPAAAALRAETSRVASARPATVSGAVRARHETNGPALPALERRRPATEITRRIERAVQRLAWMPSVPAAHTIDVDGGRVRVIVHHDGRATRIVALCSSPLREPVERALASARFALAGAGMAVSAP